jgi:hypothetical protein
MNICVLLLLAVATPKEDFQKAWLTLLKTGMTEVQVLDLLGQPRYVARGYPKTVYYYQPTMVASRTPTRTVEDKTTFRTKASVEFTARTLYIGPRGQPNQTVYLVTDKYIPDWDSFKPIPPAKSMFEPRPGVSPKSWEFESNWQELLPRMKLQSIQKFLGPPDRILILFGNVFWFYGDIQHFGYLRFYNNVLIEWTEPYWPDVNTRLYEPDPPQNQGQSRP